jgi:putative SOS response-associated peptidase YedK
MCGRYTLTAPSDELVEVFDVGHVAFESWAPRFNLAPTQDMPVIILGGGARRMGLMRWGLVPAWADHPSVGNRMINVRGETAAGRFPKAFEARRCLVPADGFYEWRAVEVEGRSKPLKVPFWVHRPGREPFAFAGLWERWHPRGDGEPLLTFTLLTTAPSRWMAPLHDRMPVILTDERAWTAWLDPAAGGDELRALLAPAPDDYLEAWSVSTGVNRPENEGAALVEPAPNGERIAAG